VSRMAVTLSIKNVPDDLARRLKERAASNHR
jgi:plasmid stability protein